MIEFFLGVLCGAGIVSIPVLFLYKRDRVSFITTVDLNRNPTKPGEGFELISQR